MRTFPCRFASSCFILSLAWGYVTHAQTAPAGTASFGNIFNSKTITLERKLPPVYNMSGKTVRVVEMNAAPVATSVAIETKSAIESLLTGTDSTVHVREASPDVLVEFTVTSYNKPDIITEVSGNTKISYVVGGLIISFKITLPATNALIASNIATAEVNEQFSSGGSGFSLPGLSSLGHSGHKMTPIEAEKLLVRVVAVQVASFLVKTTEVVYARLAVGKALGQPNELAEKLLWPRYLEALSTMGTYSDPQMDCYRIYDMGVANEALAYLAETPDAAIKYLQEASNDYGKATDAKPSEKNFLYPQTRIKQALSHFATDTAAPPPPTEAEKRSAAGILTDDDVVEMVQAHMDEANIEDNIKNAPTVEFDLSVAAQVKMSKDGVSGHLITFMKQIAQKNKGAATKPK